MRINLAEFVNKLQPIQSRFEHVIGLYSKILLSRGFKPNDFVIGKDMIFFRSANISLVEKFLHDLKEYPEATLKEIRKALWICIWRRFVMVQKICIKFRGKYYLLNRARDYLSDVE